MSNIFILTNTKEEMKGKKKEENCNNGIHINKCERFMIALTV